MDRDGWQARTHRRVDVLFIEDKPLDELLLASPPGHDLYAHTYGFKKRAWPIAEQPIEESFESTFALDLTTEFAKDLTADGFAVWGSLVFGADIPRAALLRLHADLRSGAVPSATYELSRELGDHLGAYGSQRILLNEQLVVDASGDTSLASALACVMVEEFGHYLDDLLRNRYTSLGGDAPADEGARFAYLLLCVQLAKPDLFEVGTYRYQRAKRVVRADWSELKDQLSQLVGPHQQSSDDKSAELEFSDAEPSASAPTDREALEILAIHALLAAAEGHDAHVLVDWARQLAARLHEQVGTQVWMEGTTPGRPSADVERALLRALIRLYNVLDRQLRGAPLAADGLPDLGVSRWWGAPPPTLWDPGSPLAGIIDDIAPFGSYQDWLMRYQSLEPSRAERKRRVQIRRNSPLDRSASNEFDPETALFPSGVGASAHDLVEDRQPDSLNDDALNAVDRGVGAADTGVALAELVLEEVALSGPALPLASIVLGYATFLRGLVIASEQHRRAAEAAGLVFAWFTVEAIARAPGEPPTKLTRERVDQQVEQDRALQSIREVQVRYSGSASQSPEEGFAAGIQRVLIPLNEELARVDQRAANAFELMIYRARLEHMDEASLSRRYPITWWRLKLRRWVFVELAQQLKANASALVARFSHRPTTNKVDR